MHKQKGESRELSFFLSWGKDTIIGYETENIGSKTVVNKIWCKICTKFKDEIEKSNNIKGVSKTSRMAFITGT